MSRYTVTAGTQRGPRRVPAPILPRGLAGTLLCALLAGCVTYQPLHLPQRPDLASRLPDAAPAVPGPWAPQAAHPFDPSDGLDWIEIAQLAVANNPTLKAQRRRRGEAQAQVLAAGLLPDPQWSIRLEHPTDGGPGRGNGLALGLGYDLRPLLTRSARIAASTAHRQQIDLQLLWQEWQVVQRAHRLVVQLAADGRRLALLQAARDRAEQRYRRVRRLLKKGGATLGEAAAIARLRFETDSRLQRARRRHHRREHELHALLGLAPDVPLPLAALPDPPAGSLPPDDRWWRDLPRRRPDLLALQAGYRSQEQRVRQAVLLRFPALHIGLDRSRDNDGLHAVGLGVTLDLPLFSGARGRLASERATRARLRAEYQARLDQTRSDVARLLDRQRLLRRQRADLLLHLPGLESLVTEARRAYRHGDLAARDLLDLERTWLDQRLQRIDLDQALWEVQIALDTLLARPSGGP